MSDATRNCIIEATNAAYDWVQKNKAHDFNEYDHEKASRLFGVFLAKYILLMAEEKKSELPKVRKSSFHLAMEKAHEWIENHNAYNFKDYTQEMAESLFCYFLDAYIWDVLPSRDMSAIRSIGRNSTNGWQS